MTHHPLEYVIFPFVIAAAMRRGQPATSLVVLGASAVTIWQTVRGVGPFAGAQMHDSLVLLQVFMLVLSGTGLLLAAAIAERETGERRRAAAYAVGAALARAPDITAAAPAVVRALCEHLEWQVGSLWLLDPGPARLRCIALWSHSAADRAGIRAGNAGDDVCFRRRAAGARARERPGRMDRERRRGCQLSACRRRA